MSEPIFVVSKDGSHSPITADILVERFLHVATAEETPRLDMRMLANKVMSFIYSGIPQHELDEEVSRVCMSLSTLHPYYSYLGGRLLAIGLQEETAKYGSFTDRMHAFQDATGLLDTNWLRYIDANADVINSAINRSLDRTYDYFGFKTLHNSYFLRDRKRIFETPQDLWMRVASYINQGDLEQILRTYRLFSEGNYTHATPTLFHAGYKRFTGSSCFLLGLNDSTEGIAKLWHDIAQISRHSGGVGIHVSGLRGKNSLIKGNNGRSSGVIKLLKVVNEVAREFDQAGKRPAAIAAYLEPHHPDIFGFVDLRRNTGSETERARDLFLALFVSDLFMKQVRDDREWYLLSPDECPGLNDVYGEEYENLYWSYVNAGKARDVVPARKLMKTIMDAQIETGMPYIVYKDSINKKSNQKNIGIVRSSNLCAEIALTSSENEYAVCNLCSLAVNRFVLPFESRRRWTIYTVSESTYCDWTRSFMQYYGYDYDEMTELPASVKAAIRTNGEYISYPQIFYGEDYIGGFKELWNYTAGTYDYNALEGVAYQAAKNLDGVIDLIYCPLPEIQLSNLQHRPLGVGIQGVADALVMQRIPFESERAVQFNALMMESIYLGCMRASCDIARSRMEPMGELKRLCERDAVVLPATYDKEFDVSLGKTEQLVSLYHMLKPNKYDIAITNEFAGAYSTYKGSPISEGLFQFDLWGEKPSQPDRWEDLRRQILKYGVRNSTVTALMPTASTSQILGNNECFEFFTNNIYTRNTLAGDFPLVNKYLINDLSSIGLWTPEHNIKDMILAYSGSLQSIDAIPSQIKIMYKTMWETKQLWVMKQARARAPFVDQTQSMNLFMAVPDYERLFSAHMWGWENGLKTGMYYLRSRPASSAVQVTIDPRLTRKAQSHKGDEKGEGCLMCSS